MKKAVIFDLDGTLLNTLTSIAYCGNKTLEMYGIEALDVPVYTQFIGRGADVLVELLYNYAGATCDFESFKKDYMKIYRENGTENTAPYKNIPELLEKLKESQIKLAVLSNKPMPILLDCCDKYFNGVFDIVLGQQKDKPTKPDPTQLYEILEHLEVQPCDCIFCGDSGVDIETGHNAKMTAVGAAWGFYGDTPFEKADAIAYDPLDVLKYI